MFPLYYIDRHTYIFISSAYIIRRFICYMYIAVILYGGYYISIYYMGVYTYIIYGSYIIYG